MLQIIYVDDRQCIWQVNKKVKTVFKLCKIAEMKPICWPSNDMHATHKKGL